MFQPEIHLAIRARLVALLMVVLALTGFFGGPSRAVGLLCQGDALSRSPLQQQIRVKPRGQWLIRQADTVYDAMATRWSVAHGRPHESHQAMPPSDEADTGLVRPALRPWLEAALPRRATGSDEAPTTPPVATPGSRAPPAA